MDEWTEVDGPVESSKGYAGVVMEFYESSLTCVMRDFGGEVKRAYVGMRLAAKRKGIPVMVIKRGTTIYLKREQ